MKLLGICLNIIGIIMMGYIINDSLDTHGYFIIILLLLMSSVVGTSYKKTEK